VLAQNNAILGFKLFGNPAVTSGATITGSRFTLTGLSNLRVDHPPATWPGTIGSADHGSRYQASDSIACLGGAAGCANTNTSTALGVGGSYALSGGAYAGVVTMTMGASALTLGTVQLGFPYVLTAGRCTASFSNGSGGWNALVSYLTNGLSSTGIAISWANNGAALVNGSTYFINYTCQTGH
jgi:hypothetical protein